MSNRTDELLEKIIAFESGELSNKEGIQLFQELIDSGEINNTSAFYQNKAFRLMAVGACKPPQGFVGLKNLH